MYESIMVINEAYHRVFHCSLCQTSHLLRDCIFIPVAGVVRLNIILSMSASPYATNDERQIDR